jgi:NAD+ diphosphatase
MRPSNLFASGHLDRAHHLRAEPTALASALANPGARAVVVWRSRSLVLGGEAPQPALLPLADLGSLLEREDVRDALVLLGIDEGHVPYFAVDISPLDEPLAEVALRECGELLDLRQIGGLLDQRSGSLLAYARAMATWHRRHRFCGSCGARTEIRHGGHLRSCTAEGCDLEQFPRSDPAVIMLVYDESERCLLGRQSSWPGGVFSTLAGFVEPGESLEDAVAREVFEEVGIRVLDAAYHSSQPWPFPTSLMLGFFARAEHGDPRLDPAELESARWFGRDELHALIASREVRLPPRVSIARRLIDDWLTDPPILP